MTQLLTVFRYEWRALARNRVQLGLLAVLLGCYGYALYYGAQLSTGQRTVLAELRTEEAGREATLRAALALDTTTSEANAATLRDKTTPFSVDELLARHVVHAPSGLSALIIGQKDVYPYYRTISGRSLYSNGGATTYDNSFRELRNPEQLLAGNFDWAFVTLYLLPLFIIALTYNVLAAEQEGGTFALLRVAGLRPAALAAYRLLFYFGLVLGLSGAVLLLGLLGAGATTGAEAGRALGVAGVLTLYVAFWFALVWAVVAGQRGSATNALLLVGSWLLLLLLLPGLLAVRLDLTHPVPPRAELARLMQTTDIWEKLGQDSAYYHRTLAALQQQYPQFRAVPARFSATNMGPDRVSLWHVGLDELTRDPAARTQAALDARYAASQTHNLLSPASLTQELLSRLAGTDLRAYRRYQAAIRRYHRQYQAALLQASFRPVPAEAAIVNRYPTPAPVQVGGPVPLAGGLLTLLAGTALLLAVGAWRLRPRAV